MIDNHNLSLPDFEMVAGESKSFTIPLYTSSGYQIDASGMTARFAICDYVNSATEPYVSKPCSVIWLESSQVYVLHVTLDPAETINLCGKYWYQITAKDVSGSYGVLRGHIIIHYNGDPASILI